MNYALQKAIGSMVLDFAVLPIPIITGAIIGLVANPQNRTESALAGIIAGGCLCYLIKKQAHDSQSWLNRQYKKLNTET
jgi:hypothetical protein